MKKLSIVFLAVILSACSVSESISTKLVKVYYADKEAHEMLLQYPSNQGLKLDSEGNIYTKNQCALIFKCKSVLVENVLFFETVKLII